jgi:DNA-binding transcriptional MerR regulator
MLIGELAKALGVTPKTLRHYETIGLVPAAERARNGYRTYSLEAIRCARLVVDLRSLGLTLDTIQELLAEDGRSLRQKLLGVLDQQIQAHALQIAVLQGRYDDLNARYHALLSQPAGAPPDCICGALMRNCDCRAVKPSTGTKTRTAEPSVPRG